MSGTNSLLCNGHAANAFGSATHYTPLSGGLNIATNTTEAAAQNSAQTSATYSNMGCNAAGAAGTPTYVFRKAGSSGNQTVSVSSSQAWYSDTTHSDSVVAGNAVNAETAGSGNITYDYGAIQINSTNPLAIYGNGASNSVNDIGFSTTTQYAYLMGAQAGTSSTESVFKTYLKAAGTLQDLTTSIIGASSGSITIFTRKNVASNGNQTLSIASGTGQFQDTTHTDSVTSGDYWDYSFASTNSSGSWSILACAFAGTKSTQDIVCSNSSFVPSSAVFEGLGGGLGTLASEASAQTNVPYACTGANLRAYSTSTITATITSRVAGGAGNQTCSFSASTGLVTDSTHSDTLSANTLADYEVSPTGSAGMSYIGQTLDDGSVGNNTNVNAVKTNATGAVHALTPNPAANAVATHATGVARATLLAGQTGVVGVHGTGVVRALTPDPAANPTQAAATGHVRRLSVATGPTAAVARGTAVARGLKPSVSIAILGTHATGVATVVDYPGPPVFPVFSIMRDTPVACVGAMDDTVVAVIGRLYPSGPQPASVEVNLVGVAAVARVIGVQVSFSVRVTAGAVFGTAVARNVGTN